MAGDCLHDAHLEAAMKHHHVDSPPSIVANHEMYLKIIDDLKHDLEQMSCEVVQVHKECCSQDKSIEPDDVPDLESSLKELESQNDRLGQALKFQTQKAEDAHKELEANNYSLNCQIEQLKHIVSQREEHIRQLTAVIARISQKPQQETCPSNVAMKYFGPPTAVTCCSSGVRMAEQEKRIEMLSTELDKSQRKECSLHSDLRKLNEELNDSKRRSGDLLRKTHDLADLLKRQERHRKDFTKLTEELQQKNENQAKLLKAANAKLTILDERFELMQKSQAEHEMERNLLREELLTLKEKEAVVVGRQKSLEEQYSNLRIELFKAQDLIKDQQHIIKTTETENLKTTRRLQEESHNLKRKLEMLIEDYQRLKEEYGKERDINKKQEALLTSYRKWREEQLKAEESTRQAMKNYEDQIYLMLRDKKELVERYRTLSQEYNLLEVELERIRVCSTEISNAPVFDHISERTLMEKLNTLSQTTKYLSEQTSLQRQQMPQSQSQSSATISNENPSQDPS